MNPDDLKTWIDIGQGVVSILGILGAGLWSLYTFVLARSFAPNMRAEFELKRSVDTKIAIVSVKLKNIGRSAVIRRVCFLLVQPVVGIGEEADLLPFSRLDTAVDPSSAEIHEIFGTYTSFEPDAEVAEDIMFSLGEAKTLKVEVQFEGRRKIGWFEGRQKIEWQWSGILDAQEPPLSNS